jgi:hypothetical protein
VGLNWADKSQLGWWPTAKIGEVLGHGARAGEAVVGRIPNEGQRGTVGQQVRKEISEVWTPIWGLGRGDAHMRTFSVVVQKNRVVLTGARPGKRQVAMMVRLERTGVSRWSSRVRRWHQTGTQGGRQWGGTSGVARAWLDGEKQGRDAPIHYSA